MIGLLKEEEPTTQTGVNLTDLIEVDINHKLVPSTPRPTRRVTRVPKPSQVFKKTTERAERPRPFAEIDDLVKKSELPGIITIVFTVLVNCAVLWFTLHLVGKAWDRQSRDGQPKPESPQLPPTQSLPKSDEYAAAQREHGLLEPVHRVGQMLNPRVWQAAMERFLCRVKEFFNSKKPSWETISEQMDPENKITERPLRLCPSAKDARIHNVKGTHAIMGASCLAFMLPSLFAFYLSRSGQGAHCKWLTLALNVFLCYVSTVSFGADYWYTGDTPASKFNGIGEYKKQWIANYIDLINVPIIAVVCITSGAGLFLFSPGMNWVYPAVFGLFATGVAVQQWSLKVLKRYTDIAYAPGYDSSKPDPEAAKTLSTYLWMHTAWHVLAVIAPLALVYGFMVHGIKVPCFS